MTAFRRIHHALAALFIFLSVGLSTAHEYETTLSQQDRHRALFEVPKEPCGLEDLHHDELLRLKEEEASTLVRKTTRRFGFELLCLVSYRICPVDIEIPVYVHNIKAGLAEGKISRTGIRNIVRQANQKLRFSGIRLAIQQINYIENDDWYFSYQGSPEEIEMQSTLKVGGAETMNVYLKIPVASNGDMFCGYANLGAYAASVGVRDGVVVHPDCAEDGKTFTHEVGHYLNLHHTFAGGCYPGDLVDDTPPQSEYVGRIQECPSPFPDSCPNDDGNDPLDNAMDYNPVSCRNLLTEGQYQRMRDSWAAFRDPETRIAEE